MKKMMTMVLAGTAMAAMLSTGAMASESEKIESNGIVFEIPGEYRDLLTVETEGLKEGELIQVSETASIEAARKQGSGEDGAGWLFTISRVSEKELEQMRCGMMDGTEVFAEDDDLYYLYNHPTDVRLIREDYEYPEPDMEQWTKLNEWAGGQVRDAILKNNPQLEPETFTNTMCDILFSSAAYDPGKVYEIRGLEFGTLDPRSGDNDGIEELAEDFTYEVVDGQAAPDGEYLVLFFPEENIRFDFFQAPEGHNLVRMVQTMDDGEETETLYKATSKDGDETTTDTMQEWVNELRSGDDD